MRNSQRIRSSGDVLLVTPPFGDLNRPAPELLGAFEDEFGEGRRPAG